MSKHNGATLPLSSDEAPARSRRSLDLELQCMAKIDRLMAELPTEASAEMVYVWFRKKYESLAPEPKL